MSDKKIITTMTEEEKKEFEEFLKWKAEKAKQAEQGNVDGQEIQPDNSVEEEKTEPQQVNNPQPALKASDDVNNESSNKGLMVLAAIIVFAILIMILIGLSNKNKTAQPAEVDDEYVLGVDTDSILVVEPEEDIIYQSPKAEWNFNIEKDEMTDSKNIWATITSDNYIRQDFPYEGQTRATIIVRYMKKYGYDVLIQISQGQMNGREYYGTDYVTARFDDGSPKKYYFNESADGDSKVVFLRKSSDFIKNCKSAKDIKIDLPLYQGGRPVFTFHVDEPLTWREE